MCIKVGFWNRSINLQSVDVCSVHSDIFLSIYKIKDYHVCLRGTTKEQNPSLELLGFRKKTYLRLCFYLVHDSIGLNIIKTSTRKEKQDIISFIINNISCFDFSLIKRDGMYSKCSKELQDTILFVVKSFSESLVS